LTDRVAISDTSSRWIRTIVAPSRLSRIGEVTGRVQVFRNPSSRSVSGVESWDKLLRSHWDGSAFGDHPQGGRDPTLEQAIPAVWAP